MKASSFLLIATLACKGISSAGIFIYAFPMFSLVTLALQLAPSFPVSTLFCLHDTWTQLSSLFLPPKALSLSYFIPPHLHISTHINTYLCIHGFM